MRSKNLKIGWNYQTQLHVNVSFMGSAWICNQRLLRLSSAGKIGISAARGFRNDHRWCCGSILCRSKLLMLLLLLNLVTRESRVRCIESTRGVGNKLTDAKPEQTGVCLIWSARLSKLFSFDLKNEVDSNWQGYLTCEEELCPSRIRRHFPTWLEHKGWRFRWKAGSTWMNGGENLHQEVSLLF